MKQLIYENLGERLVEAIPELQEKYIEELKWWGTEKPGPHVIFGDLLSPLIISLIESGDKSGLLDRIFRFLEEMATHSDVHVREVVAFSICERLGDNRKWLREARRHMGKKTLELCAEVENFWGRKQN